MMIECCIIDRDPECRNQLRGMLSQYPFIRVAAAHEFNAAASQFSLSEVHAIFSDTPRDELFKSVAPNRVKAPPTDTHRGALFPFLLRSSRTGNRPLSH